MNLPLLKHFLDLNKKYLKVQQIAGGLHCAQHPLGKADQVNSRLE